MKAVREKAQQLWESFDDNEKTGVRFGMFPFEKMQAAIQEGYDSHELSVSLMDVASKNGGVRA